MQLTLARACAAGARAVRVRFAPSPTGRLHLGGLRTALYNYLFARAHGGAFLLRVEDTDQARLVPGAAAAMEQVLGRLGLRPDESPAEGGPRGPYTQSERLGLYSEQAERLLRAGAAYRCFCSGRRLDLLKKEAARTRQSNKYDRKCLQLPAAEVEARLARGEPHTVRLLLLPHPEPWHDIVYGDVTYDVFEHEGDPIIVKSDGFPTYHLASVVDDHLMDVSHVLRGVEWQASTPKHLLLYRALGWHPPTFGHLPLIVNPDGSKLSKRQGDLHVETLLEAGNLPEAVINYVTLVGGGFEGKEHSLETCHALPELQDMFRLGRVATHPGRLEPHRLQLLNRAALRARLDSAASRAELVEACGALVRAAVAGRGLAADTTDTGEVERLLAWAVGEQRINTLGDIVSEELLFLWAVPEHCGPVVTVTPDIVSQVIRVVREARTPLDSEVVKSLKKVVASEGVKFPVVMADLRTLLTGRTEGPPVLELLQILGPAVACRRLHRFIDSPLDPS